MKKITLNLRAKFVLFLLCFNSSITVGQDLFDSNGTLIWNATANSTYNYNVDLIGRDDLVSLNKKQNTDIDPLPFPVIGLGNIAINNAANPNSFSSDRSFLVWGDNNNNMNDSGLNVNITFGGGSGVTTSVDIPNKKWKIVETDGDVHATQISIPTSVLSGLPSLSGNDAYVLLVADDEFFTNNLETVFLNKSGTNQLVDYDFDGTKFFTFGVAHLSTYSRSINFDGISDVIKFDNTNNISNAFTMMFWIKPNGQNSNNDDRTIIAKHDGITGYRIYLSNDNKINVSWTGGITLKSNTALPDGKWHNIVVTFSGNSLNMYIDCVLDSSVVTANPTITNHHFSMGAEYRNKLDVQHFFKGEIDEFRLWNRLINIAQLKFILNQEIVQYGSETKGVLIPSTISKNDIRVVKWSYLVAYYSMNSFIGTNIDDDSSQNNRGYIINTIQTAAVPQSAPILYQSVTNGLWSNDTTWSNDSSISVPNAKSIVNNTTPITWNIVKTDHNVTSLENKKVLGLLVSNNTYSVSNDTKIDITHYLKLDGKMDLVGRSQLIQPINSEIDPNSIGLLERDQQGQSNKFNYNYWSSPVSSANNTTINHGFTVANVLKDGTTSIPQNLNWTSGVNGSPTSPVTLSRYWIFKFQDLPNGTANWSYVGNTGSVATGQGFTLKGSGAATANQNYTFVGKPNNGTITSMVLADNLNLTGNPYPSAIDANKFIDDNVSSITGTLYFWEHYNTNNSHASHEYQGGYATYTKTGGTAPVAPSGVSGLGSSSKKPKKFIPVGQGFFIKGSATGGAITFKNSQRAFIKENNLSSYTLFRQSNQTTNNLDEDDEDDEDDETEIPEELFIKIRLGYDSADQHHRQTLIGFMNQYGSPNYDDGYDGISLETLTNDMYFISENYRLNIMADGYFNPNNSYPIGVKNAISGNVKFSIDELENTEESLPIYLFDNVTNTYHNINQQAFEVNLPAGTFENRFSLRFSNSASLSNQENSRESLLISYSRNTQIVTIQNNASQLLVKHITLYNLLGQKVYAWSMENTSQSAIHLNVNHITTGAYLLKVTTDKGIITKKIGM
jgi:hypothetical protein